MINIENQVFNSVAVPLRNNFTEVSVTSEIDGTPSLLPAVALYEMDNSTFTKTLTASGENHCEVMYQCDIYTKSSNRKQKANEIATFIDATMSALGFVRMLKQPVPNLADAGVYRITMRYKAVVAANGAVYSK